MRPLLLTTVEYETQSTNPRSDLEVMEDLADYLKDREAWQWMPGWTIRLLSKKDNFYTVVVEGEWNDKHQ